MNTKTYTQTTYRYAVPALALLFLTVLLLGCSDASLVGAEPEAQPASDAVSMAKNGVKYVPYKLDSAAGDGEQWWEVPPTIDFPFDLDLGDGCVIDLPSRYETEFWQTGTGKATHMGAVTVYNHGCFDWVSFSENWGKTLHVAANGDFIEGEFAGGGYDGCEFDGCTEVTGGTGRFENATTPPEEPLITAIAEDGSVKVTGRISSVGSSK